MAVSKARKAQIAWWARKVNEQAAEYAGVFDPELKRISRIANKLDTIERVTREIHFELTGTVISYGKERV